MEIIMELNFLQQKKKHYISKKKYILHHYNKHREKESG